MKKSYPILLSFVMFFIFLSSKAQTYRYAKSIFPSATKTANVVYGNVPFLNSAYYDEGATTNGDLLMDIYEPTGDTRTDRPAIIFAHGGGFATGNRNVDDMEAFCDSFARKGYVTVTIDYRQGVEVTDNGNLHYTRAAYRGLQDGRTAVRFIRANAATYGIDPTKIYWGGNSAGSFIGLNAIYMDADEKPADAGAVSYSVGFSTYTGPDLGNLDIGGNLSENGEPDAVMACWGGVGDVLQVEAENNQNVFLVHGTADGTVPFNSGPPFGLSGINDVFGSNAINTQLNSVGIPAQMTYFVEGEDHEFYGVSNGDWDPAPNEYWDTVVVKATKFYHEQFKPTADFSSSAFGLDVDFSDLSSEAISWIWDFGDSQTSTDQNPSHTFAVAGDYNVMLYVENSQANWDTISKLVSVDVPMAGTYTIGSGSGNDYTILYHALQDIQNRGVSAPVVFELASDYAPSSEAYPISISSFSGATYSYTLTIKPASGTSHIFSRSASSIFLFLGATHVIIDGSNNGTDSKDITISNISADDNTSGIAMIDNPSEGYDITIKNCIIRGSSKEYVSSGIFINNFVDVTIEKNKISRARTGIYSVGSSTINIMNNEIGSDADNEYLHYGISVKNGYNINVKNNTIFNLEDYQDFDAIHAIALDNLTGDVNISGNFIDNLIHTGNNVVQSIAILDCNPSDMKIYNNRISNIASNAFENNYPAGIAINCPLMTSGMQILYNSINIPQNTTYGIGTEFNTMVGGILIGNGSGIVLKNNIISNKLGKRVGATFSCNAAGVIVNSNVSPFAENDNNLFFADGTDYDALGMNTSGTLYLSDWQTWTGGGANSFYNEALFVSDDDLNLQACSPAVAHAVDIPAITTDIEDNTRDTEYPSMGAYGYDKVQASYLIQEYPVKEDGGVMLSWTKGSGCKSITFMKEGNFLSSPPMPINGTYYMPDFNFGLGSEIGSSGWFCVSIDDSDNTFNTTSVVNNQEYTVMVCEYFGSGGNEIYLKETSSNNPILVTGDNSGQVLKLNSQLIKINPNPTTGKILIDFTKDSNFGKVADIKISDISGKVIYNNKYLISNNQLNIDLSEFGKGLYFIKIKNSESVITKKLILE